MNKKSERTLTTAQFLINNKLYTDSIHCSYYAVLQKMKYVLANTLSSPISLADQKLAKGVSSHEFILSEISNRIIGTSTKRKFVQTYRDLKRSRVEADYELKEFTLDESKLCYSRAVCLLSNLKTYFGNI